MRLLALCLLFGSVSAWSQANLYSSELVTLSQEVLCDAEDFEKTKSLLDKVRTRVNQEFEDKAKAANSNIEEYLNKKETSKEFLNLLKSKNNNEYINSLSHAEFMLESLVLGLQYQTLATVRFPSMQLIDEGGQILQDKWMAKVMEISENPQGCQNSPKVNSSSRETGKDVPESSSSESESSSGAISN